MPDLLLELFSEEIPARMQRRAAEDLKRLVTDALVEAGLLYEGATAYATPRRLGLAVAGLPARSPDTREEKKGPRVGAPEQAVAGFLKAAGLASLAEAKVQSDPKKGDFYVAVVEKAGRPTAEIIAEALGKIIRGFPWPKSMRWGEASAKPGSLSWVRPLHSILCTFGPESDPEVVPFEIGGIVAGDLTYGHRFMAPHPVRVTRFDDYQPKLEAARVVVDLDKRKDIILHDARDRALALGLELVEDEGLLEEVAGLVEWPVVLAGSFDEAFLAIPPEVIRTTIRANQKCFVLARPQGGASLETRSWRTAPQDEDGGGDATRASSPDAPHPEVRAERASKDAPGAGNVLSNRFLLIANIEASDGGAQIVAGNQRVIRARLSDARHFWDTDLRPLPAYRDSGMKPLDQRLQKLRDQAIVFHARLGTQSERVDRLIRLAREIAPQVGADPDLAARAAELAKTDLVTEMVGEFPELQGLMGRYYATKQGEHPSVAAACEEHYKPVGPGDRVPRDKVAIAVALADKLDTLTGFWAIDEKPTGSKDPYALRRAALGVIRIVLENGLRVNLGDLIYWQREIVLSHRAESYYKELVGKFLESHEIAREHLKSLEALEASSEEYIHLYELMTLAEKAEPIAPVRMELAKKLADAHLSRFTGVEWQTVGLLIESLLAFFADRLKVQLREQGARHDLVDAVFALGGQDDLVLIVRRIEALAAFLDSEDGRSLLTGYRRAANILKAEEKSGESFAGAVDPALLAEPEERALAGAIEDALSDAAMAVAEEDFALAMSALAHLRGPVDAFFAQVLVNAPDPALRANRLRLLARIRAATLTVADFSRIAG